MNPLTAIDFYKADHRNQYPEGTSLVFSNFTPRYSRIGEIDQIVFFGLEYYLQAYLTDFWHEGFFSRPKTEVIQEYKRRMTNAGISITYEHIEALHDYGKLPLEIWALDGGMKTDIALIRQIMNLSMRVGVFSTD